VRLRAFGFDGMLGGSLLVIDRPERPPTSVGVIRVTSGTFKAYGQDLTIDRGQVTFAGGPLTDPGLDLRAYRKATDNADIRAGVQVTGTAKRPEVSLWSEPAMSQTDQLAYVLLGHPLDKAQPGESSMVANAATSLGLRGGNLLAKRLASRFGLEEARFESQGSIQQASFVLGKYLSPRLYVSYGIGLFQAVNTFRVRYIIDRHWTLQAESGATSPGATSAGGTGADLLYTVERGQPDKPVPPPGENTLTPRGTSGTGSTGTSSGTGGTERR
jgi:translocation and assembly module TamB